MDDLLFKALITLIVLNLQTFSHPFRTLVGNTYCKLQLCRRLLSSKNNAHPGDDVCGSCLHCVAQHMWSSSES